MKTEDAVGCMDRMISEQEDYKVYAFEHRSDDEELLCEVEVELDLHMAKKALEESTHLRERNRRLSQQITNLQTQLARKEIVIQDLNEQSYKFLNEVNRLLAEVDQLSEENEELEESKKMTEIEARLNWRGWEVEICIDDTYFRCTGDNRKSAEAGAEWIRERMVDAFSEDETLLIEQQSDICQYANGVALNAGEIMRTLATLYENQERHVKK